MTEHTTEPGTDQPTLATVTTMPFLIDAPVAPVPAPASSEAPTVVLDKLVRDDAVLDSAREVLAGIAVPVPETAPAVRFDADVVDLDAPLIPAWMKTPEGWASFAGGFYRSRRRAARRWVRRQRTNRGHLAQARRGVKRTHDWVVGFEGVRVQSAAHAAHIATQQARAASRAARYTPALLKTKKELALKASEKTIKVAEEAVALHKKAKKDRARARNLRGSAVYGPPLAALVSGYVTAGWLGASGAGIATFAGAAFAGRQPYVEEQDWSADWRSLGDGDAMTAPMLDACFRAAKVIGQEESLRIVRMPMLDARGSWTAVIDLPPGVPAKKALRARDELASAFMVEEAQLSIEKLDRSNRIELYVSRTLPFTEKPEKGPLLLMDGPTNFWGQISIGPDVRGIHVSISVVERSGLVGGEPGAGKSGSGNTILLAAALDPRVILWLADGKAGGDLEPFEKLCERFEGDADPEAFLAMLDDLIEDMRRRYKLLKKLGKRKVTEELANAHPELRQLLLWVDELMLYTTDDEFGRKITKKLRNLVSRGRAAGIITFCATQKPGSDVVDTSLRDLLAIRWALRCNTAEASDTILGRGAAASGYSSKSIDRSMRGAGLLYAEGTNPSLVRADFYNDDEVNELLELAAGYRRKAGTLPTVPASVVDQLRETGDEDALILAGLLAVFEQYAAEMEARGEDDAEVEWLPGSVLVDTLTSQGLKVTAEKLGALVVRTDDEKAKKPWNGSRVAGYPLSRVTATVAARFGLTA